jgi:hypothetical protein
MKQQIAAAALAASLGSSYVPAQEMPCGDRRDRQTKVPAHLGLPAS